MTLDSQLGKSSRVLSVSFERLMPGPITRVWKPGDRADAVSAYPVSYLSFTLEQIEGGVLLRLSHVPVLDRFEKQNAMGWHAFLDMFGAALRGEVVEERSPYIKKNAAFYGVDMTKLAR